MKKILFILLNILLMNQINAACDAGLNKDTTHYPIHKSSCNILCLDYSDCPKGHPCVDNCCY